tara:strand:- start:555 stop:842 length:288 start_codon:yes stop_codon:yes gene_type:complete
MIALKTVDLSWYQILDYFYNIEFEEFLILFILSIFISTILHFFYNKISFNVSNDNNIEIREVQKYSLVTKTITVFLILILISMPVFKLLKTGYFL